MLFGVTVVLHLLGPRPTEDTLNQLCPNPPDYHKKKLQNQNKYKIQRNCKIKTNILKIKIQKRE